MKRKILTPEERIASRKEVGRRYYLKNREKILIYTKKYAKDNAKKSADNLRKWRARNKERHEKTSREWALKNPEKQKAKSLRNYYKNKEKAKADHKSWSRRNKHLLNIYTTNRRKGMRFYAKSDRFKITEIYKECHRISGVLGIKHSVDHVIPVSKGCFHHESNLQILPNFLNQSKHGNPFWISPVGFKDWRDVPRELWPTELVPRYLALIEQNKGVSIRWDAAA